MKKEELIKQKAKEDFNRILNSKEKSYWGDEPFKENMRDLFLRHKDGQYDTDFFVQQMEVYWRMVVEHFRREVENLKPQVSPSLREIQDKARLLDKLCKDEEFRKKYMKEKSDNSRKTQSAICMPLCVEHDCPRPCPICDKDNPKFKAD